MKKSEVIVIGAGLFGSAIAKHLIANDIETIVIDSDHPLAASKCSFGVWKEGWINESIKEQVYEGLEIVEGLSNGMNEIEFENLKTGNIDTMYQVNCKNILDLSAEACKMTGNVVNIIRNCVYIEGQDPIVATKKVVLATGAFVNDILQKSGLELIGVDAYWGRVINVQKPIQRSRIFDWAPYKQAVLVKDGQHAFRFGDGATVKNPNGEADYRLDKVRTRAFEHLIQTHGKRINLQTTTHSIQEGFRPYLQRNTGFIREHNEFLVSATGGAKNSTLLCGYIAKEILKIIS